LPALPIEPNTPLRRLPLVTLYLTERCNSRCITCDYWRHGRTDLDLAAVAGLLPSLRRLGTETVVLSGGEPLLNRDWGAIAALLGDQGLDVWLLTSGLSLAKHARRAGALFRTVTVSLDGTDPATYAAIRGVDAFDVVCRGVRTSARRPGRHRPRSVPGSRPYRRRPGRPPAAATTGSRRPAPRTREHAWGRILHRFARSGNQRPRICSSAFVGIMLPFM
jgi:hypothetical protein